MPRKRWGAEGFSEAAPFCFTAPAEHRAEGWQRKAGTDPGSPWLPRTGRAGVSWALRPPSTGLGDATSSVSAGLLLPGTQREGAGTWWQDMFQQGLLERGGWGPGPGQCQWAMGDSNFCRRRRRSSAASGSPSSGSSSVPTDSGAGGFSGSGAGGEAPEDGVVASELGMLVEEAAATTVGTVSSGGLTEVAGRGGLGREGTRQAWLWHPGMTRQTLLPLVSLARQSPALMFPHSPGDQQTRGDTCCRNSCDCIAD